MSKINKNSINFGFKILTIFAFSLLIIPFSAEARRDYGQNVSFSEEINYMPEPAPENYTYAPASNPKPYIYALTPSSANRATLGNSISIEGKGFIPSSVAKVNGVDRPTTFIDSRHLLLKVNGADMARSDGGFYVTVWNEGPGGGYSDAKFFTVKNVSLVDPAGAARNSNVFAPGNSPAPETMSDLTSNAIFGGNTFLPSGIVQWVLFAIIVLILVIMSRKFFGGEEAYHAAPLKHD